MRPKFEWALYGILLIAEIFGLLSFFRGFFPHKVVLAGDGTDFGEKNIEPVFEKMIVMVVDAMRSDFVFSDQSAMKFVQELLIRGDAVGLTAHATPPTVTLPRLKGITTGSTPNFLDAILNVAEEDTSSTLGDQDSWIKQLHRKGSRIHMFGDDTWLKLFPGMFSETDGTSSFFVSDFTEVDANVTRHIDDQLAEGQWDTLILHYLGLDHIGHKGGPDSVFMAPKQREMDAIIAKLYQYTEKTDTVLIVLGDHGMNEIGNHGGSSSGETSAGMVFISPKFRQLPPQIKPGVKFPFGSNSDFTFFRRINQIDLVPTLSALLDFPIPRNNLGVMIREFLPLWSPEKQQGLLSQNKQQLDVLMEASGRISSEIDGLDNESRIDSYYRVLAGTSRLLSNSANEYDYDNIYMGLTILAIVAITCVIMVSEYIRQIWAFLALFLAVYAISFHGSSLIEEEHQIWWLLTVSMVVVVFFSDKRFYHEEKTNFLCILTGIRLIRAWNSSGQKYFTTGIAQFLDNRPDLMWLLVMLTYAAYSASLTLGQFNLVNPLLGFIGPFIVASVGFSFKMCQTLNDGNEIPELGHRLVQWVQESLDETSLNEALNPTVTLFFQLTGGLIGLRILFRFFNFGQTLPIHRKYKFFSDLSNVVVLFLMTQTAPRNIPMYLVFYGIRDRVAAVLKSYLAGKPSHLDAIVVVLAIFTWTLQNLSFFSMGYTNSLATVDLSNAYNGVASYNIVLVGILTFLSNFAGPIFWSLALLVWLFENGMISQKLKFRIVWLKSFITLTVYSISAVSLVGSCINLRFHLFVWTVFSPKLLYFAAWNLLMGGVLELIGVLGVAIY